MLGRKMASVHVGARPFHSLHMLMARYRLHRQGLISIMQQTLTDAQLQEEERNQARGGALENSRSHAALGDIIMHRAQFLTERGEYEKCDTALRSWAKISESQMEARTLAEHKTAEAKNLLAKGNEPRAIELLESVAYPIVQDLEPSAEEDLDTQIRLYQRSFNWATITLAMVYCSHGSARDFQKVLELSAPRLSGLLRSNARYGFLAADYRILTCEVMLRTKEFDRFQEQLDLLVKDLEHPLQRSNNPRQLRHMWTAKCLFARFFHMQERWAQATDAWVAALLLESITEDMIDKDEFKDEYRQCICVYSLAVCLLHRGSRKAKTYFEVLEKHVKGLRHPRTDPDYTQWLTYLSSDHSLPSKFRKRVLGKV